MRLGDKPRMWLVLFSGLLIATGMAANSTCPSGMETEIEIIPERAAVKFMDPFSANCTSMSNGTDGMGWESQQSGTEGPVDGVSFLKLDIPSVKEWELAPYCYVNLKDIADGQCDKHLTVVIYKLPDSVTLSQSGEKSPWVEGGSYQLQCDLLEFAPARNFSVSWHIGDKMVHSHTFTKGKEPVNESLVFNVSPTRDHNGTQVWCEAKLNLQELGVNPPPVKSKPRDVIVLYPPTFNNPENQTLVFDSGERILNCTAAGNPEPTYTWHLPNSTELKSNKPILTLSARLPGTYTCKASNPRGSTIKHFEVEVIHINYLLIIGIVAAIVLVIVVIFIIYRIYYKNKRIRRYIFKQPNSSANNGRVAHESEEVL